MKRKLFDVDILTEYSNLIYLVIIYISSLVAGSLMFKALSLKDNSEVLDNIMISTQVSFFSILIQKIAIYLIVFTITVLLGLCLAGNPIVDIVPFICGFISSVRLCYYYNVYNTKGFGYSLALVVPQVSLFVLIVILAAEQSKNMSKVIYNKSTNKEANSDYELASYLKNVLLYMALIIVSAVINSTLVYLFNSIITL